MAEYQNFSEGLLHWYDNTKKRQLVWKQGKNPYHIWLSEIILQQTRVEQGTPYYLKFITKYPSLVDLANAPDDEVMKLWQGLGYYARARNMLETARQIRDEFNGVFPDNYENIRKLKGIGDYTAAAIASFAFDLPYAVLDGNVYRVLSRYFGIEVAIDSSSGKKIFQKIASENLISERSADYNQAIMDFGATICKPQSPYCINCPLAENCFAFKYDKISKLPFKSKKLTKKNRYFYYFVFKSPDDSTIVKKRDEKDIWKSLYDFPLFENDYEFTQDNISNLWESDTWKLLSADGQIAQFLVNFSTTYVQLLTHQKIFAIFVEVSGKIPALPEGYKTYRIVSLADLKQLAFPKTIQNYLEKEPFVRVL
jgi:A/G-specific adenine glycosylase